MASFLSIRVTSSTPVLTPEEEEKEEIIGEISTRMSKDDEMINYLKSLASIISTSDPSKWISSNKNSNDNIKLIRLCKKNPDDLTIISITQRAIEQVLMEIPEIKDVVKSRPDFSLNACTQLVRSRIIQRRKIASFLYPIIYRKDDVCWIRITDSNYSALVGKIKQFKQTKDSGLLNEILDFSFNELKRLYDMN